MKGVAFERRKQEHRGKRQRRGREKRKMTTRRERCFGAAFSGLETQRNDMNTFVTNFTRMQEQQVTTMNALVGALRKFLEKQ